LVAEFPIDEFRAAESSKNTPASAPAVVAPAADADADADAAVDVDVDVISRELSADSADSDGDAAAYPGRPNALPGVRSRSASRAIRVSSVARESSSS
jgi:hypothetical protein